MPVHRDQFRTQRWVISMGELHFYNAGLNIVMIVLMVKITLYETASFSLLFTDLFSYSR